MGGEYMVYKTSIGEECRYSKSKWLRRGYGEEMLTESEDFLEILEKATK